jgi:hypothetical protein
MRAGHQMEPALGVWLLGRSCGTGGFPWGEQIECTASLHWESGWAVEVICQAGQRLGVDGASPIAQFLPS